MKKLIVISGLMHIVFVQANDTDLCKELINEKLIDSRSTTFVSNIISKEFDEVCSRNETENIRNRNISGTFRKALNSFNASYDKKTNSMTLEQKCAINKNEFLNYISSQEELSSGVELSKQFNHCIELLRKTNQDLITGTVKVADNDQSFLVDVKYFSNQNPPVTWKVRNIESGEEIVCTYNDDVEINGNLTLPPGGQDSFNCTKAVGQNVNARLIFELASRTETNTNRTRIIPINAASRNMEQEIQARIRDKILNLIKPLNSRIDRLENKVSSFHNNISILAVLHVSEQTIISSTNGVHYSSEGTVTFPNPEGLQIIPVLTDYNSTRSINYMTETHFINSSLTSNNSFRVQKTPLDTTSRNSSPTSFTAVVFGIKSGDNQE